MRSVSELILDASSAGGPAEAELLAFLLKDRATNAYAIGDLDPQYVGYCRWFVSRGSGGSIESLALLYTGLRMPALLTFGAADGIDALMESPEVLSSLPATFYAHIGSTHLSAFQGRATVDGLRSMVRMALPREAFVDPGEITDVVPVSHADTAALMALYRFYPDNFFEPYQLGSGYYFGLRSGTELVSVAGVHVVSERYDIGVVGNVVTHPQHRSRGYSRRCTARLLQALFQRVSLVTLNVQRENAVARRVYEGLGFAEHMRYLEGPVRRLTG